MMKPADLIDNTITISRHDPSFWKVYRREVLALLDVLEDRDPTLWRRAAAEPGAACPGAVGGSSG